MASTAKPIEFSADFAHHWSPFLKSTCRPQPPSALAFARPPRSPAISAPNPDVLAPSRRYLPPIPGRILLQHSRPLLNWKYYDDIVGCGFPAAPLATEGRARTRENHPDLQFVADRSSPSEQPRERNRLQIPLTRCPGASHPADGSCAALRLCSMEGTAPRIVVRQRRN